MDFPITDYPTKAATDPQVLYRGLGSFWTQVFQEKATLKGLTTAQAEELIQRYYDLIETLDSLAVRDIQAYHTEKWLPIILYKSKFNQSPLRFAANDVVWGTQPNEDLYYGGVTFQFGSPKIPSAEVYTYTLDNGLQDFFTITDKVIDPSVVLVKGTDVILEDDVLFFNKNIFELPIPRTKVISDLGEPVYFTDLNGAQQEEEFMVLWMYHGKIDKAALYENFGVLFSLNSDNPVFLKRLLGSLFNLYVEGPTVRAIKTLCAALLNVNVVRHETEVVEHIMHADSRHIVITDKDVYRFDDYYDLLPSVVIGATVKAGDILVDAAGYYDNVVFPNWWDRNTISVAQADLKPYLTLSKTLFLGNYKFQLTFKSGIELVSIDQEDKLHFPVQGLPEDVVLFNKTIDTPAMRIALGVTNPGDVTVVNPVDFLFRNFFRDNMAMIKLKFKTSQITADFLKSIQLVLEVLPKHIYVIFDMTVRQDNEIYAGLNGATPVTFYAGNTQLLNADGSNDNGEIEKIAPLNYQNIEKRLFMVSKSPEDPPANAVVQCNGVQADVNDTPYDPTQTVGCVVRMGSVDANGVATPLRPIPPGATTATYSTLRLLKFS